MGERVLRMYEVRGSNPLISTILVIRDTRNHRDFWCFVILWDKPF